MNSAGNEVDAEAAAPELTIPQAIVNQVGQHESLIRSLIESNNALLKQVSLLTSKFSQLSPQAAQPVGTADSSPPSVTAVNPVISQSTREPNVPVPERFSGDGGSCQAFLTQVSLVFDLQPLSYSTDRAKIAFLVSLLTGAAREWGTAVWDRQEAICNSYTAFKDEMKKIFDHPIQGRDASHRLLNIRQGNRSVAEFSVEFRALAAGSGWNDESLQVAFYAALHDSIKDELATWDETTSLDETIALATRIDTRIRERRRERSQRTDPPRLRPVPSQVVSPSPPHSSDPEPMQLGRTQLSAKERKHRRDTNACMYCGKPGHFLAACPLRQEKETAHQ
uniref:CCHC-type domain-containing protein n=1 Tax=Stegastes partitus TaxID=144197 RepID=A0A3B4ZJD2_9TELE